MKRSARLPSREWKVRTVVAGHDAQVGLFFVQDRKSMGRPFLAWELTFLWNAVSRTYPSAGNNPRPPVYSHP